MAKRQFDELNNLQRRSIDYEKYFGEMGIAERDKKRRIRLAEDIEEVILYMMFQYEQYAELEALERQLVNMLADEMAKYVPVDDYLENYAKQSIDGIMETTNKEIDKPFTLSHDRAILISENLANDTLNYGDFKRAKGQGKKYKTWFTMGDEKVRPTHEVLESERIPIDDLFWVGSTQMRFPKDTLYSGGDLEEIAGCRCWIEYS
jgi:hypothetical protein